MANLARTTAFKSTNARKETPLDKTTRIVRGITEDEAEIRHQKTARLRKARFENTVDTPADKIVPVSKAKSRKR